MKIRSLLYNLWLILLFLLMFNFLIGVIHLVLMLSFYKIFIFMTPAFYCILFFDELFLKVCLRVYRSCKCLLRRTVWGTGWFSSQILILSRWSSCSSRDEFHLSVSIPITSDSLCIAEQWRKCGFIWRVCYQ